LLSAIAIHCLHVQLLFQSDWIR